MTVFGTVLKIDSIKKRMRKLTGMEEGCAKWMTNVRNERGKILVTVLTDSESTHSLQPIANGLVKRFERRQRKLPSSPLGQSLYTVHQRLPLLVYHISSSVRVGAFGAGLGSFFIYCLCILVLCIRCFLHIVYPALLVIFTSVLCLIHSVSLSFVLALYLSATFPWSYHHLTESMTFVSFAFTVCLLAFVQF